jgi:hypothetical protein
MIRRREAHLRSLFQRLLLLSAAASPAACSSSGSSDANDAGTAPDATLANEDGSAADGGGSKGEDGASSDAPSPSDSGAFTAPDALDPYGFLDASCDPEIFDGAALIDAAADASDCQFFERLPCGLPPGSVAQGCQLGIGQCGTLCNQVPTLQRICGIYECLVVDASAIPDTTPLTLECATGLSKCAPGLGRRPEGLACSSPRSGGDAVGAMLAEMAHLEAASVHAFRRLGRELSGLGAPRALVRTAERSARDEVRHTRVTARLAGRRGATPAPVVIDRRRRARSVADFAVENAVEGCVRECFGALVATRQASAARNPEVAKAMRSIAVDETRHAALAWEIARWLAPRLDARESARVARAMRGALEALRCEVATTPAEVARALALPTGAEAVRMLDAFAAACLSPAMLAEEVA